MEADRLEQWLRQLMLFSSPEGNIFTPISIVNVIQDGSGRVFAFIRTAGVKLELAVDDPAPLIKGDRNLLEQAFNSVISNALEATPNGGLLKITVRTVDDGEYIKIDVTDNGHGIPGDRMNKIFKPFYTSKSSGLGLGLSLVRRIVERHKGAMTLSSKENRGTTVTFRFPSTPK